MKYKLEITFNSEIERQVFIKVINKAKQDGTLTALDFGNLTTALKDMDAIAIEEN